MDLPTCPTCTTGILLPLSDYGPEGAAVRYKAWACSRSECGYALRADKGVIAYERVTDRVPLRPDQGSHGHPGHRAHRVR
jgi:hypothetical protein